MENKTEKVTAAIGATFAIVGVVVVVAIFWVERQDRNKKLEATVISQTRLLNPDVVKARKNMRLLYGEKEVYDLSIIQIRIKNSGRQPIKSEDIEEPITIVLEGISEILWAEVVSTEPPDLIVSTSNKGDCVELSRALLNPDDQFIVEVVSVPSEKTQPNVASVKGRIAGVKHINLQYSLQKAEEIKFKSFYWTWIATSITALLTVILFSSTYYLRQRRLMMHSMIEQIRDNKSILGYMAEMEKRSSKRETQRQESP